MPAPQSAYRFAALAIVGAITMLDAQITRSSKAAAAAQNAFGAKLLAEECARKPGKNVFLSPLSVFLALGMLENGAAGKTLAAMRQAMAVPPDLDDAALQQAAAQLSRELRGRRGVELAIANALWSDPSLPLAPQFVRRCRELYEADAFSFSFQKPDAADIINAWVKEHTRGKIPVIVEPETVRASRAILTNAIYFKGEWRDPFSREQTRDGVFHLAGGGEKKVRMMAQGGMEGAYRSGDGFEAAALAYGESGLSLYAILPANGLRPEAALSRIAVDRLIHGHEDARLNLQLPRFTLDYETKLKDALTAMGMGVAFQYPGAEFAPLGSPLFFVGDVIHKTRLEVDERGTVAAAATAIVAIPGSAAPRQMPTRTLVFDRPFALLLCDTATGAVLFAGAIYEPM